MTEAIGPKQQQLIALRQAKQAKGKQKAKEQAWAMREATVTKLREEVSDVTKSHAPRVTKPASNVTKQASGGLVTKPRKPGSKGGRPLVGKVAMTSTERMRRLRELRKRDAE